MRACLFQVPNEINDALKTQFLAYVVEIFLKAGSNEALLMLNNVLSYLGHGCTV